MLSFLFFLITFLVLGTVLGIFRKRNYVIINETPSLRPGYPGTKTAEVNVKGMIKALVVFIAAFVVAAFSPISVTRIDVGHVGIKVDNTGDQRGVGKTVYVTGWVFYNDWISRIYEFPVRQQHVDYEDNNVLLKGGFVATIKPTFNYSLVPGSVGDLFSNVNLVAGLENVEKGWLKTAVVGAINDVSNTYTVDSIFNHREQFENDIRAETNKRIGKWFNLSQLRTNIMPPQSIVDAVNAKTKAIQDVQVAENRKKVAVAEGETMVAQAQAQANTKIVTARGDSASNVIAAAGRAESIRREQAQITSLYIDYTKVQKWNGEYPQVMSGSGSGLLMQLSPPK